MGDLKWEVKNKAKWKDLYVPSTYTVKDSIFALIISRTSDFCQIQIHVGMILHRVMHVLDLYVAGKKYHTLTIRC